VGLLVLRVVIGAVLADRGWATLSGPPVAQANAAVLLAQLAAGVALVLGLLTPLAAVIVATLELYRFLQPQPDPWIHILVTAISAALALLGPGARALDAWLFGWERIKIPDRRSRPDESTDQ
jgi:uncharacterized membrane protein YphA (DoxX/SURF4 family)